MKNTKNTKETAIAVKTTEAVQALPDTFIFNGEQVDRKLHTENIKSAALLAEVETAQAAQDKFALAAITADEAAREYCKHLHRVFVNEWYKPDFKSIKEYAEAVGILVSKSQISEFAFAGAVYSDENAPEAIRRLSWSVLAKLRGVIKDTEARKALYDLAKTDPEKVKFTQTTADEYNKAHAPAKKSAETKTTKGEQVNTFTAKTDGGEVYTPTTETDPEQEQTPEQETATKTPDRTLDEYKEGMSREYAEVIELPEKDNRRRLLGIDAKGKPTIVYLTRYDPAEAARAEAATIKANNVKAVMRAFKAGDLSNLTPDQLAIAAEWGLLDEDEDE